MTDAEQKLPVTQSPALQPIHETGALQIEKPPLVPIDNALATQPAPWLGSSDEIKGKASVLAKALKQPEIIAPRSVDEYVTDFKMNMQKNAHSTLAMSRVVHEARETLKEGVFTTFCEKIGFAPYSSTITKFACIGRVHDRLMQHIDRLPANWTSLYLITQIPADYFDQIIAKKISFEELTGSQIKEMIQQARDLPPIHIKKNPKAKDRPFVYGKLIFTKQLVDDVDYLAMRKATQELEARLPVKFIISKGVDENFEARKLARYRKTKLALEGTELKPDLWDFGREATATARRAPAADVTEPPKPTEDK